MKNTEEQEFEEADFEEQFIEDDKKEVQSMKCVIEVEKDSELLALQQREDDSLASWGRLYGSHGMLVRLVACVAWKQIPYRSISMAGYQLH